MIYTEERSSKVPLSDCFNVRSCLFIKQVEEGKCEIICKLGIEFIKSTMFKGKIIKI